MSEVTITNVEKRFGEAAVLHGISLTIPARSLVTLLGPSGCGKTTLLRLVAGLEESNSGTIAIGGRVVSAPARNIHVPAAERRIGMVFQSYALWPHRRVWENVAHPLRVRKLRREEIRSCVTKALALVKLEQLAERFPGELSGGQQQRVALARAIVYEPEVLLLDEPLSNLDAKLRAEMRYEIRELQGRSRLTMIYVTHDQEEAFVISDHICLMHGGRIEQMGGALELYEQPQSRFVADFVGAANQILGVTVTASDNAGIAVQIADLGTLAARCPRALAAGARVCVLIRPEDVRLADGGSAAAFPAMVSQVSYLGGVTEYTIEVARFRLRVHELGRPRYAAGQRIAATIAKCIALPE